MPKVKTEAIKIKKPISREEEMDELEDLVPKAKIAIPVIEDVDDEKAIDPDGILGDDTVADPVTGEEDEEGLDDEEVDPFKDKWEE